MAITKNISANASRGRHNFSLNVVEDRTSGNSSFLSFNFSISAIQSGWDWYGWGDRISYSVNINGNTYTGNISDYGGSGTVTLRSESNIEIPHNSDGTKTISISFTVTDTTGQSYTCGNASASDTMTLSVLHKAPVINTATMVETNSVLTALNVPDTTVVQYLSKKTITLSGTAYDSATLTYRLEHFGTSYNIPSSGYQSSNIFNTDYTQNNIIIGSNGKVNIIQKLKDSMNGEATDWVYVNINNTPQKPNGITYTKPTLENTSTNIRRKTDSQTTLTDNKAVLNLKGTIYKASNVIGNNNSISQIGYKIWQENGTEPSNYTAITPIIDSSGNVTVNNLIINNINYTKKYLYKIIIKDTYNYSFETSGEVPTGIAVWSEYKDRVDFLKLTVKGYDPFEYSTNETICGEWIGKPLYRKTIEYIGNITSGVNQFAHNISNIDMVYINMGKSFIFNPTTGKSYPFPINQYNSSTTFDRLGVEVDRTNVTFLSESGWSNWDAYITLEYTKTTD